MGAGCNYTIYNNSKAIWLPIEKSDCEWQFRDNGDLLLEDIGNQLESIGYEKDNNKENTYYNGLVEVIIKSTYYGEAFYLYMQPLPDLDCYPEYNLALSNMDKMYNKIKRHFVKAFLEVRTSTSGWTSENITEVA